MRQLKKQTVEGIETLAFQFIVQFLAQFKTFSPLATCRRVMMRGGSVEHGS